MTEPGAKAADGQDASPQGGGEVFFYHMTRTPLEATLPVLLQRSLEAGWKVCIRGRDANRLEWLDELLWTSADDSFLPHGPSGGPHDADQPVLLTTETEADADTEFANAANALLTIDGAAVSADEMTRMTRVSILFDGNDPDAVAQARSQWKEVVAAGCTAKYWSQESGRWEMKVSTEPSDN